MTLINFTGLTDANTTGQQMIAINTDITGGLLMLLALIALFAVMLLSFNMGNFKLTLMISSFLVTIIAGMMWTAQLIPFYLMVFPLLFVAASVMIYFLAGD